MSLNHGQTMAENASPFEHVLSMERNAPHKNQSAVGRRIKTSTIEAFNDARHKIGGIDLMRIRS